ncbi:MAG: hypothetical protein GY719_29375 [bacterium]|nr:hypothetical protein [bacterium]
MSRSLLEEAFRIQGRAWDRREAGNFEDAEIREFEGMDRMFWLETTPKRHPPVIEVVANTRALAATDLPFTDRAWPIVSRRMLHAILSTGSFAHETVPVHFLPRRRGDPEVQDDYVVLRLLSQLDVFDRDRSEFKLSRINPKRTRSIRHLVLRCPQGGFPPCFRVPEDTAMLFLSGEAKAALEEIGVRGLDSLRVSVSG